MMHRACVPDALFLAFQTAVAGRYSIDRELGRGGMGVVYLAREVQLDRLVAIKLLPPELSVRPELRERFLREAQLAAKLSHPNIIPIHAVEERDGFVYYVMAYVDGETLAERVQSRGPLSVAEGIRLLREVAWALGHAHLQGLVHRDVKPDNILIEGATGRALVVDFGIAAAIGVAHDGISGTPEFMSPEQALGGDTTALSDLYSLGVTAFYALSGRLPFEGGTATEMLARHVTAPAPSVTSMGVHIPRSLAQLIDRCLAKDPAARPPAAQAFADGLGLALEQRRELPAVLRAFVKRNGRMDGAGTVLGLLGALVASVGTAVFTSRETGVAVLGVGIAAMPVVFGILAARRLLDQGFMQADLGPAFRGEQETSREERGAVRRAGVSWRSVLERLLGATAKVSAAASVVLIPVALSGMNTSRFALVGTVVVAGLSVALLSAFGCLALVQLRRDVDIEFWSAVWNGRFGTAAFSIARKWRGAKPLRAAMTHRATELSLGMAAEQLFESLPRASRDVLHGVPEILQRLQRDAAMLRTRYDVLQDALAGAGAAPTTDHHAAVREERDTVQNRLRDTVGALETIRLGLLRLHGGSMSLESLTTHIGMAAEASAHVERLLLAQVEVERVLSAPHAVELTRV